MQVKHKELFEQAIIDQARSIYGMHEDDPKSPKMMDARKRLKDMHERWYTGKVPRGTDEEQNREIRMRWIFAEDPLIYGNPPQS